MGIPVLLPHHCEAYFLCVQWEKPRVPSSRAVMFRDSHMCGTWPPPPAQELIRSWVVLVSPGVSSGLATGAPAGSSGFCGPLSSAVEKAMAPHSSTLAWEIPWTEEPGRLQSMGLQSRTLLSDFTFTFHFHALEKEMATHSSILAWRIPGMGAWWAAVYGVT